MKAMQKGFTLIELMIVVAIIGILAAVAIPAYQDYTIRTHVSEGVQLASSAKVAMAEYYANEGVNCTDNDTCGIATADKIKGNAVDSVTITDATTVQIQYNTRAKSAKCKLIATFKEEGSVEWTCACLGSTLKESQMPTNCRH